jgi:hypothetical protein
VSRDIRAAIRYVAEFLDSRPPLAAGLSLLAAAILVGGMAMLVSLAPDVAPRIGIDFRQYTEATSRWWAGGSFYQPWQLSGPYDLPQGEFRVGHLPVLYPPYTILLFAPFALAQALAPLWWTIPLLVTGAFVVRCRPRPWTWTVLTFCLLSGDTLWLILSGNPALWATAAVALGIPHRWPAVAVLVKPTVAPFALVGARSRSWWLALAALGAVSLVFAPMWPEYLIALRNIRAADLLYSLNSVPMLLIPLVAWIGKRDTSSP